MLKGSINDDAWRSGLPTLLRQMLERLADPALRQAPVGRHDLEGEAFFVINEYETRPAAELRAESHRRYCDVQVMLAGTEQVGCAKLPDTEGAAYDAAHDVTYYPQDLPLDWHAFGTGTVFVFTPDDIHLPGVTLDRPAGIRKVVGKLPWATLASDWPPSAA